MSYWEENDNLQAIERLTEVEVQEMLRQLELGYEEAMREFEQLRNGARDAAEKAIAEIDEFSDEAEGNLVEVRRQLGQLNLLLALEKIDDAETVEGFRVRILDQIDVTLESLRQVEGSSRERMEQCRTQLQSAWRKFLRHLELVRVHLAAVRNGAAKAFEGERRRLSDGLSGRGGNRDDASDSGSEGTGAATSSGYKHADRPISDPEMFKDWLKGFFQHPDIATPDPPESSSSS